MSKIRVLVSNYPRLLRELIAEMLEGQPDLEVAVIPDVETLPADKLVALIRELTPDFIITRLEDGDLPAAFYSLLENFPALQFIAIGAHTDRCVLFRGQGRDIVSRQLQPSEKTILDLLHTSDPKSDSARFLKAG